MITKNGSNLLIRGLLPFLVYINYDRSINNKLIYYKLHFLSACSISAIISSGDSSPTLNLRCPF